VYNFIQFVVLPGDAMMEPEKCRVSGLYTIIVTQIQLCVFVGYNYSNTISVHA